MIYGILIPYGVLVGYTIVAGTFKNLLDYDFPQFFSGHKSKVLLCRDVAVTVVTSPFLAPVVGLELFGVIKKSNVCK